MARLACTSRLEGIGPRQLTHCQGNTVAEVLEALAPEFPRLKHYVLDDQGKVRKHVAIFVGGELVDRDQVLHATVGDSDEIYIMPALSGG